ncbi:hypothetical protein GO988_18815 [Hymenobacter sp. HMF4947]|uniref:Uncharacterized protein n=1 Tax=Hymenobacter ginkgonis TaxID=2682976 RepID=A0A7K1TJ03_9BACT|nr:hypothetical protein [Hymenobacter ginkgonis]MVN78388.1 hypothetical protein [Hymenobacter ginkgonis]
MPSNEDQAGLNSIAGNGGAQPANATTKMGADVRNTSANSSLQPATPAMQPDEAPASADGTTPTPSTEELFDSEQGVGQGAVEAGGERENAEANPADVTAAPTPPTDSKQPNSYGGNFGNDVQSSFEDHDRNSNQRADANRGEFGQQEYNQGVTHGGYGNQYRETNYAAEHNAAAEATQGKYYGQGSAEPGPQHNSYRAYDGRDLAPDQQGHAVRDTPAQPAGQTGASSNTDGRGNTQDNRNLPGKSGEAAAFQNDNGSVKTGAGYAADYGHTSGVGLPAGTADNHAADGPAGRNQQEDQRSSRGGYDNQGSQGGRSHDEQPGGNAPAGQQAPAPIDAPGAPQTEGYGYGHARSEETAPGNPNTGDSRNGFGAGGSKEGNTSQGHGSKGGSYDDENPGARGPEYDNFSQQDKAKNYGQGQRDDYRPAEDEPNDADYGAAPRRNAGRDEPAQ